MLGTTPQQAERDPENSSIYENDTDPLVNQTGETWMIVDLGGNLFFKKNVPLKKYMLRARRLNPRLKISL